MANIRRIAYDTGKRRGNANRAYSDYRLLLFRKGPGRCRRKRLPPRTTDRTTGREDYGQAIRASQGEFPIDRQSENIHEPLIETPPEIPIEVSVEVCIEAPVKIPVEAPVTPSLKCSAQAALCEL